MTHPENKAELLPCAHCGSNGMIKRGKTVMVSCAKCTAATFQYLNDKVSAIEAWNRRAALPPAASEPTLRDWLDIVHDNGYSLGDRLQRLSSRIQSLLKGAVEDKYAKHIIREQVQAPVVATTFDQVEFDAMVEKGTLAWKDVPDDWLERQRGNLPPAAAAPQGGQSHPYERDLAGLTEFIDAMCAGDSKSMALVQSAWYRCMARNHPANQAVPPAWTASQISSPAYQAEQSEKNRMMSALLESVAEGRVGPAQVGTLARPVQGMVLVSIADIHAINRAMQHMGDALNEMDAVEEGDDDLAAPGFEAMERLIAAAPNHGASAAAFTES